MDRIPEAERMDRPAAATAYANADFRDVNHRFVRDAAAFIAHGAPKCILDLGCGPGDISVAIAQAFPQSRVVAVDAAEAMLAFAAARAAAGGCAHRIQLIRADAKRLPFPGHAFDAVVSNSILHHVADPVALWCESTRIAKPGAAIFMRDLMRPESTDAVERLVNEHAHGESKELRGEFVRSLCAAYTPAEIEAQLAEAGLPSATVEVVSDRHVDVHARLKRA